MAQFTMTLGEVMQTFVLAERYKNAKPSELWKIKFDEKYIPPDEIIDEGKGFIFDFEFELSIPNHKSELILKILRHYFYREICVDMPQQFKFFFRNTFLELLPYYNKMYYALNKDYDFLENYKMEEYETRDEDTKDEGHSTSETNIADKINKSEDRNFDGTIKDNGTQTNNTTEEQTKSTSEDRDKTNTIGDKIDGNSETNTTDENTTTGEKNYNKDTTSNELLKMSDTPQSDQGGVIDTKYLTRVDQNARTTAEKYDESTETNSNGVVNSKTKNTTTQNTTNITTEYNEQVENDEKSIRENGTTNNTETTANKESNKGESNENIKNENENYNTNIKDFQSNRHRVYSGLNFSDQSALLKSYYEAIRNVDLEFINALQDCFMCIYE